MEASWAFSRGKQVINKQPLRPSITFTHLGLYFKYFILYSKDDYGTHMESQRSGELKTIQSGGLPVSFSTKQNFSFMKSYSLLLFAFFYFYWLGKFFNLKKSYFSLQTQVFFFSPLRSLFQYLKTIESILNHCCQSPLTSHLTMRLKETITFQN